MEKFHSWYKTDKTEYVDLCCHDIEQESQALNELQRIQNVGKYNDEAEGWKGYHEQILLENILYLFDRFDITIEDLQKKLTKMEELQ